MDAPQDTIEPFATKFLFRARHIEDKEKLLIGKDKQSTQCTNKGFIYSSQVSWLSRTSQSWKLSRLVS